MNFITRKSILDENHYEKLTVNHDLNDFSCGNDDLDEFLKKDALPQQEKNLNVTYLAMRRKEILGFISISADNIRCRDISKKKLKASTQLSCGQNWKVWSV